MNTMIRWWLHIVRSLVFLGASSFAATAVTSGPSTDPALAIRGVGLGSTPASVQKHLGKPERQAVVPENSEMGMGKLLTLVYSGMTFELCRPPGQADFHVWRFTVTALPHVVEPGLKVGMARPDVLRLLGQPSSSEVNATSKVETLHYSFRGFDGWYWVAISQGKVTEIGASEDWS